MKDNTLRGEIENILDSKVDGLPSQKLAVEKLEALLAEEVRKAKIDTAETALIACPTKDNKLREWLEEHIRSLEKESK